jgi:hypothetical protein
MSMLRQTSRVAKNWLCVKKAGESRKSQSSFEFIFIIVIMVVIVVILLAVVNARGDAFRRESTVTTAEDIGQRIVDKHLLIATLSGGVATEFVLPQYVRGTDYQVTIIDNRELVVVYKGYEYVQYLHPNLNTPVGPIYQVPFGKNTFQKKLNGSIFINPT